MGGLGERWLDLAAGGQVTRRQKLERGRSGAGRLVEVLQFQPGGVSLRVPGGRGRSTDVAVDVPPIDDDTWQQAVELVRSELRHTAALLEGVIPEVLLGDGLLLPDEVAARCTCSEARPCRHEAAAHHAIATALDREPTRLLRLGGRSADELLDAVRESRGGRSSRDGEDDIDLEDPYSARGDLDAIDVHPVPHPDVSTIFERLGAPPGFEDTEPLERLMSDAAAMAWRLAAGEGSETADAEALLTELRAQGVATAGSIASSLGLDPDAAQAVLDAMYSEGQVLRMGEGESARYRAA